MIRLSTIALVTALVACANSAMAQERVKVGMLECRGSTSSFVVGVGANALVGGSNNTIALQPVSLQGQTGLSAAAGVASMDLRPGR